MDDREALVCLTAAIFAGNEGMTPQAAVNKATEALAQIRKTSFDSGGEAQLRSPRIG